ncbi:RNA polymerase sigma-70 factor [Carboxylicivirga sp. A043]|uniref:RNA polymerase sigma factor n=1 Tax=Carboxylicivirga litoralis TaxID=2816963 RepID=UPI0021CB7E38|nr:RNA polymerase sigma-70 factor [Carboxylicivirga sp. A043]MCU4154657.1 RNA polymerase sigma-70 factor [Carboxylicivirga sp. A043]
MTTEEQHLNLIAQGNKEAFEQFFQQSYMRLLNYASLFIPNREIADDIVQEAFINFWNKRSELKAGKSIEALMFTSVRNRCLNYLRDHQTYLSHIDQLQTEKLQFLSHYDFLGEEEESIEELLITELHAALDSLPPKCKEVFLLNKIEGFKQKEIAEKLDISIKAVEKHIAVAKVKLREHLEKKFPALGLLITFFLDF